MKPINNYENEYLVCDDGRVYRCGKPSPLRAFINPQNGYLYVSLWKHNKGTNHAVHRLVAEHFIPNPENKPNVNHKDSDRENPRVDNLEWCTQSENILHGYEHGFMSQEGKKLVNQYEFSLLLASFLSGVSMTHLAKEMGCGLTGMARNIRITANELGLTEEFEAELVNQKRIRNTQANASKKRKVAQYTLQGDYVATHDSLGDAAASLGKSSSGSISNALNPKMKQEKALGFLWKYV